MFAYMYVFICHWQKIVKDHSFSNPSINETNNIFAIRITLYSDMSRKQNGL